MTILYKNLVLFNVNSESYLITRSITFIKSKFIINLYLYNLPNSNFLNLYLIREIYFLFLKNKYIFIFIGFDVKTNYYSK